MPVRFRLFPRTLCSRSLRRVQLSQSHLSRTRQAVSVWIVVLSCLTILPSSRHSIALELGTPLLNFIEERFGTDAKTRLEDWEDLANQDLNLNDLDKLKVVNAFFNQAKFISDQEHWGKEDYWATPVELLATNAGDCEDYSIAKYFTLKEMGFPIDQLKITYVKALQLNQAHMVLAYYPTPQSVPLILDNLIAEILPATERHDLLPVYSFNAEGIWLSKFKGQTNKRISGPDKLDNWLDMMSRQEKLLPGNK